MRQHLGLLVSSKANQLAMELAEKSGSGWVSVSNNITSGLRVITVRQTRERDLIGRAMTNSTRLVVPLWDAERMLGTASLHCLP